MQDLLLTFIWTTFWVVAWCLWALWDLITVIKYDAQFPDQMLNSKDKIAE